MLVLNAGGEGPQIFPGRELAARDVKDPDLPGQGARRSRREGPQIFLGRELAVLET